MPSSVRAALRDPNWHAAMEREFSALQANHTWRLVDRPAGAHIISGKWVFTHKLKPDGSLDRYKARWVVRGFTQRAGVDFGKAFTPVVKPATIALSSPLLHPTNGRRISSMCLMLSSMDICVNMSSVSNRLALLILPVLTLSAYSINLSTA
jgi:hypothetical protein